MNAATPGELGRVNLDKEHVTTTFFSPGKALPRLQVEGSPQRLSRLPHS